MLSASHLWLMFASTLGMRAGSRLFISYRRSLARTAGSPAIEYRGIPHLPHPIWMRPGTTDWAVFIQTFISREYALAGTAQAQAVRAHYDRALRAEHTPLIIDAGANIGLSAIWFAHVFPRAKILAIEPESANFEMLQRNCSPYANIACVRGAVLSERGYAALTNPEGTAWAPRATASTSDTGIPATTIDELIAMEPDTAPFIVKLDVEGSEQPILAGGSGWIPQVPVIIFEPHDFLFPWQSITHDCFSALVRHGPRDYAFKNENIFAIRAVEPEASLDVPGDNETHSRSEPGASPRRDAYEVVRALLSACGPGGGPHIITEPLKGADIPWNALPAEAEHHGVTPQIAPMLAATAAAGPGVPDDIRRTFAMLASRQHHASAARERCIDRLLAAFAAADLPVILLKGAALAHLIYPAPALRAMADVDLLIEPADQARAKVILRDLGYEFAPRHESRFAGRMHHLPAATITESGFRVTLEIHLDAMSPNQPERLPFAVAGANARSFRRGAGPPGMACGHVDMLRHLARHAFEPARRIRLIHLYDLWRYPTVFRDDIDWDLTARCPQVAVALCLAAQVFAPAADDDVKSTPIPAGVGLGMTPLSEIAENDDGMMHKLSELLAPPAWWLHGFYGIPPGQSLLACRTLRHPATVARWLTRRLAAGIATSAPAAPNKDAGDTKIGDERGQHAR